jgi:hypothetical protein
MKLNEFNMKPGMASKKALQETFKVKIDFEKLGLSETKSMLRKVKGLIKETRETNKIQGSENNPAYLKLMFMEQALTHHYGDLKSLPMYFAMFKENRPSEIFLGFIRPDIIPIKSTSLTSKYFEIIERVSWCSSSVNKSFSR